MMTCSRNFRKIRERVEINDNESVEKEAVIFPGDSTVAVAKCAFVVTRDSCLNPSSSLDA